MRTVLSEVLQSYGKPDVIKIKNPAEVEKIINGLIAGGAESLQVIADFDKTLTRYHKDGKPCDSTHCVFENSTLMSDEFREKSQALLNKYYPIEIDHTMTVEEKIPFMLKWYEESHENMASFQIMKQNIKSMVETSRILFRDGVVEILKSLNEKQVPVMVFSAGVGDILEEVLRKFNSYHENTRVVSNFMEYNDEGRVVGFKEPLIHMFNKNEKSISHSQPNYFEDLSHRRNVILLGDSLGDVDMMEGVNNPGAILKIGFLNAKFAERLDSFMEAFDIVLIDDQSMEIVSLILAHVLQHTY